MRDHVWHDMVLPNGAVLFGAFLVVGTVVALVLGIWTHRSDGRLSTEPNVRDRIDGDPIYTDDRLNELLYANAPSENRENLNFDPANVRTTTCSECRTLNRYGYTFCRECGAKLAASAPDGYHDGKVS